MTVRELIEQLAGEDQEAEVHFAYNYGDHWRTQVAPSVRRVEPAAVRWSDYHSLPALVVDDDEKEGDKEVVVLR